MRSIGPDFAHCDDATRRRRIILFVMTFAFFAIVVFAGIRTAVRLNGMEKTDAKVVSVTRKRIGSGRSKKTYVYVKLRYEVDGERYWMELSGSRWNFLFVREGSEVSVAYRPEYPACCELAGLRAYLQLCVFGAAALFVMLITGIPKHLFGRWFRKDEEKWETDWERDNDFQ